jgi:hypothetical protein
MTAFWTMFWLGFLGVPLMIFLASKISGKDSGYQKDTSHYWAFNQSGAKVRDATVRDVWEHNHPGKKWADHQSNQSVGCAIFLVIVFIALLAWFSGLILGLPQDNPGQRLFWQIGAPLLGGAFGGVFLGIQSFISKYKSKFLKILHIIVLILTIVGIIGGLVLTFLKKSLPISQNWIWIIVGAMLVLLLLDKIFSGVNKTRAKKGGDQLSNWVEKVVEITQAWGIDKVDSKMIFATYQLQQGNCDWSIHNQKFFKETESLMLDLVSGHPMSIGNDEVYHARQEVIKTLQAFYFYCVDKYPEFKMHPRIEKALKK